MKATSRDGNCYRTVAIYACFEKTGDDHDTVLRTMRGYTSRRHFCIHKEYIDDIPVGRRLHRAKLPGYRDLMADAAMGLFDCVLVWNLNRFGCSLRGVLTALQKLSDFGIELISFTPALDTTGPNGALMFETFRKFAEADRDIVSAKIRESLARARARGVLLGRPRDRQAEQRIRKLRHRGLSLREIARREGRCASGVLQILRRNESNGGGTSPK